MKKRPIWFQEWLDHDFNHFALTVKTNKRIMMLIVAMVAAIFVRLFVG